MPFARSTWLLALGWAIDTYLIEMHRSSQKSQKWCPVNVVPRSVIMLFERLNLWMISSKSSTAFFAVAESSGLYSIHLENLSMATYMYRKPPGVGLKGPIMSSPQHVKGQEPGMVYISCVGTCICLAKNWHPLQRWTRSSTSMMAVGQ